MKDRKTLRDYANGSNNGVIECPKCGCADFRIYGTAPKQTVTFRYKSCRNCGHRVLTVTKSDERIVRDVGAEDEEYPALCLPIESSA